MSRGLASSYTASRAVNQARVGLVTVQTTLLAFTVRVASAGGVGGVGPLSLQFPRGAVAEGDRGDIEGPGALVAILLALRVIPGARRSRIGAGFRQFVRADVGQCRQSRGMSSG